VNIITTHRFTRATRFLLQLPTHLYDWHAGWLLGGRFLRLTSDGSLGAVTRQCSRLSAPIRPAESLLWSQGSDHPRIGFRTSMPHPQPRSRSKARRFRPEHRILDQTEAAAVLADYERRNRLIAPIVRMVLSRLLGWRYDGGPTARRRLVRQLPVVAFRPLRVTSAP
jgi:hypothetical protein